MPHLSQLVAPCMMFILLLLGGHQGYVAYKDYTKVINKLTKATRQPRNSNVNEKSFALFNAPVVQARPAAVKAPLSAEIEGIVASDESWMSFAMIKTSAGQQSYREGDNLNGVKDAWIESISKDKVVIHYQGSTQTLALKKPEYFKGVTGNEPQESPQKMLASLHLNDYFVLKPMLSQGHLQGYLINPRNVSDVFTKTGFQQGDLVVKVDSSDMTKEVPAHNIIANWSSMSKADVIVRRHDRLQDIQINLLNN
jgi:general secretion pathway protein C